MELNDFTLFDCFKKQNEFFINFSINLVELDPAQINVFIDGKELIFLRKINELTYESTLIFIYNCDFDVGKNEVNIVYNKNSYKLPFEIIKVNTKNDDLVLTTLFKDDYNLFYKFYLYYKNQGVSHFYMYYNGVITEEIKEIMCPPDVTLIEWNFRYWNPCNMHISTRGAHHAQIGQMHNALYKYGKNRHKFMIFCDMDEYLNINDVSLKKFVMSKHYDCYMFQNIWSKCLENEIRNPICFPEKFLRSKQKLKPHFRSKCIYNVENVVVLGIHTPGWIAINNQQFYKKNANPNLSILNDEKLNLFHFFEWVETRNKHLDHRDSKEYTDVEWIETSI